MNLKKTFIAVTLLGVVWLSASCSSDSVGEVVEREVEEQLDARDTLVPLECADVDVDDTSIYVPEDWDAWCDGYLRTEEVWNNELSQVQKDLLCSDFWETPDSDLLNTSMAQYGNSRDESIGLIDFLWKHC